MQEFGRARRLDEARELDDENALSLRLSAILRDENDPGRKS